MSPREKANILLVDDQPGKLISLETILSVLDENVIKTSSADEALKQLLEKDIAVVLVDVCMPNMDGFELAELIRTHPRFQRTAIIFISAVHLSDDDRLRGYGLGAVDYMPVPIIPEVLRAKVAVFAELNRKTNQLERLNAELAQRVSELDASNERLRFADRMANIGTLAAGLGHDMGNLLLPMRMHLESLEESELPEAAREDVGAIRRASEYLRRLARSLQLLTTDAQAEIAGSPTTDVLDWWSESEAIIRTGVSRDIAIEGKFAQNLLPARIGKAGLTQLMFNLVQNAGDALRGRAGGRIEIGAERDATGRNIILTVSDNGPGMDEVAKRRCLDPYFTTKTRELGTGLGLTLVAGLVRDAKGTIRVESEPGKGAKFRVELPMAGESPAATNAPEVKRVADVRIGDLRLLAHVQSVLTSLGMVVREDDSEKADVWISEGASESELEEVLRVALSSELSRAVVLTAAARPEGLDERVRFVRPNLGISSLRTQIEEALVGLQV